MLVAGFLLVGVGTPRVAGASSLTSQASVLGTEIANGASQIRAVSNEIRQAAAAEMAADGRSQRLQLEAAAAASQAATDQARLRNVAVMQFMSGGSGSELTSVLATPGQSLDIQSAFYSATNDMLSERLADYRAAERTLATRRAAAAAAANAARSKLLALEALRSTLSDQEAKENLMLGLVNGKIAALVAQAEQARLAASPTPAEGQPASVSFTSLPPAPPPSSAATPQDFAELRQCESGGNYSDDTGNGYYGAYQFSQSTWNGLGYPGLPSQAPPAVQDRAAETLQARDGWGPWPTCSALLGL